MERSDRQLIDATATGDRLAYALFVQRYLSPLYRFCYWYLGDRQLAEDAVQEALLRLYRTVAQDATSGIEAADAEAGQTPDADGTPEATKESKIEQPGSWAFAAARKCCQELSRQRTKHQGLPLEAAATELSTADNGQASESTTDMQQLLKPLSDQQRMLIHLKHVEGLKCKQIAERLGKPLSTVTTALSRAYRTLRELRATQKQSDAESKVETKNETNGPADAGPIEKREPENVR
jgi:RNA polymerase sigma-70 factor (ECF subfamily)